MKEMTAKQLRNEIVNKLWNFNNVPKNIQTLIDDNEVVFMMEIIKTYHKEQLRLNGVSVSAVEKILQPKYLNDVYTWFQVKKAIAESAER